MTASALLGDVSCLAAAAFWALAVTLFRRPIARFGAQAVNLGKNTIAAVLLGLTVLAAGQMASLGEASGRSLGLVAASGLVGMTLGDTALFAAVARLGAHRSLLLQTLAPVFTALLAWMIRGELVGPIQLAGSAAILAGIALVVSQRGKQEHPKKPVDLLGLLYGLIAAFGQGAGVVLAKSGMEEVPFLPAAFLRLVAAAAGLVLVMLLWGRGRVIGEILAPRGLRAIAGPALLGTYVAVLLMMLGIALAPASIAAVLLATSPVFSLFVDAKVEGTPIEARGLGGTALAVVGVALITVGQS